MTARRIASLAAFAAFPACAIVACADPVHEGAVSSLGPEAPNVGPGPLHRPGQPCLTCHGGSGPASAQFTLAGTVYEVKGQPTPLAGGTVHLVDLSNGKRDALTNSAGNFFVSADNWVPVAPLKVSVALSTLAANMGTHIGRDGSCADCHFDPPGRASPGRVYLAVDPADLPGATPVPADGGTE